MLAGKCPGLLKLNQGFLVHSLQAIDKAKHTVRCREVGIQLQCAQQCVDSAVIIARKHQHIACGLVHEQRQRIEFPRVHCLFDSLFVPAHIRQINGIAVAGAGVIGVQIDTFPQFLFGAGKVPIVNEFEEPQRGMGFAKVGSNSNALTAAFLASTGTLI